jgi:hypothetical protein
LAARRLRLEVVDARGKSPSEIREACRAAAADARMDWVVELPLDADVLHDIRPSLMEAAEADPEATAHAQAWRDGTLRGVLMLRTNTTLEESYASSRLHELRGDAFRWGPHAAAAKFGDRRAVLVLRSTT